MGVNSFPLFFWRIVVPPKINPAIYDLYEDASARVGGSPCIIMRILRVVPILRMSDGSSSTRVGDSSLRTPQAQVQRGREPIRRGALHWLPGRDGVLSRQPDLQRL